jgi:hypothetical protein
MRWARKNNNLKKFVLKKETLYLTSQENEIFTATLSRQFFPFVRSICSIEKANRF